MDATWSAQHNTITGNTIDCNNNDDSARDRRLVLRNLAMTADKLARMSMAASVGLSSGTDHDLFARSLDDMHGCIRQLCRAYQLQEPQAVVPGPPDVLAQQHQLHHLGQAPYGDAGGGGGGPVAKRQRASVRARPDKACLECGRRDTAQWRRGPLGVSTLCNACGIRHARVMKKVQRQHALRLGITSPGCTPPLPDEPDDCHHDDVNTQQHQQSHDQREGRPDTNLHQQQPESTLQPRSSVYDLLN